MADFFDDGHKCAYDYCDWCSEQRDRGWAEAERLEAELRAVRSWPTVSGQTGNPTRAVYSFQVTHGNH